MLASLGLKLEEVGYTVLKTSEAEPAEVLFHECHPDLIILEVKTSRDKGWDLLERFAGQLPVIVLSAYGREEDVVRGLEAGAVDYIAKPYRSDELLTRIRMRLGVARHPNASPQETTVPSPHRSAYAGGPTIPSAATPYPPSPTPESGNMDDDYDYYSDVEPHEADQQDSAFMDEMEELALLRADATIPPEEEEPLPGDMTLGRRLLTERKRRHITLVQAENELRIRMWYLQAMEEEKFTLLPRGQMAAQMLRSYATYLGLDAAPIMEEYQKLYATSNNVPQPSLGLGIESYRFRAPRWLIWVAAVILALLVSAAGIVYLDPEGAIALGNNLRDLFTSLTQ
jgi:CheY-like chemotaxis protein